MTKMALECVRGKRGFRVKWRSIQEKKKEKKNVCKRSLILSFSAYPLVHILCTKIHSTWIVDLNIEEKIIKLHLHDPKVK